MCGIAGFANYKNSKYIIDNESLKSITRALTHRGPDDEGYFWSSEVGLGSRRLSIIDLSPTGRMPIWNEEKTVVVVQNGEIYNYKKIRQALLEKGHHFIGQSDTEVIVHLYEEIGEKCFEQLDGMYAIAIWDTAQKKLVLARDRFGEKPLYYYQHPAGIVFSSELKSLVLCPQFKADINWQTLDQFLSIGYVLAPQTPYKNVWKLQPGHILNFNQSTGELKTEKYWNSPDPSLHIAQASEDEYIEEFKSLFFESVKSRMISDVPVGAFLSGGIDSTLVVAAMAKIHKERIHTFSIGFEFSKSHNENAVAEEAAHTLGVEHNTLWVSSKNVLGMIEKLPWLWDEPIGDPALMSAYLITKNAHDAGFKVMLSGDGGDELFLGYSVFDWISKLETFYKIPHMARKGIATGVEIYGHLIKKSRIEKGSHALAFEELMLASYYLTGYGAWEPHKTPTLLNANKANLAGTSFASAYNQSNHNSQAFYREANALLLTYLPENNQARMDRVSMANSLETRAPFLNPVIAEFAAQLPLHMKIRGASHKYILRRALSGIVSPDIINRPKHGFNALPMELWLRNELNFLVRDYLDPARLKRQGIFDAAIISQVTNEHMKGKNYWLKLWLLIAVQMWLERWANI